jgi:hypothetical protein
VDTDPADQIQCGSMWIEDPDPKHCILWVGAHLITGDMMGEEHLVGEEAHLLHAQVDRALGAGAEHVQ